MSNITREEIILFLKPMFKKEGFSKLRSTWHKSVPDLIYVFNIQGSLYGPEYYINVGIYIKALGNEDKPLEYDCHIRSGIDPEKSIEEVFQNAKDWFEVHGDINKLKDLYTKNGLPLPTTLDAKKYLSDLIN